MKIWINGCLLVVCFLLLGTVSGQSLFSFSGSSGKVDSTLTFSFYNPLAAGNAILPGDSMVHFINSGPMQLYVDTTNNCNTTTAASLDIDSIPPQTIFYNTPRSFFVRSAKLSKLGYAIDTQYYYVDTSIIKGRRPLGSVLFNRCQYFSYTTNIDTLNFYLRFVVKSKASGVADTSAAVLFNVVPALPFETSTFGIGGQHNLPDSTDPAYIVRTTSWHDMVMNNNLDQPKSKTFSYSGVSILMDANNLDLAPLSYNLTGKYSPFSNLDTLNIYAETLTIADGFQFPGTTINIYAKNLIFKDVNGKHAYLCTTPLQNIVGYQGTGAAETGLNGGDIHLHILNYYADPGKRLISTGGLGQTVEGGYSGQPGAGGNGGNVTSTLDASDFVFTQAALGGSNGSYALDTNYATWLSPNFFKIVVNYYKDAFYNGLTTPINNNLRWYSNIFDNYSKKGAFNQFSTQDIRSLGQSVREVRQVFYNLANNLDYFGNPAGWVPMLSFEVSADVYQSEVDHDMNILYLQGLINSTNSSLESRVSALNSLATEAAHLVKSNLATYNNIATVVIPDEKQQIANNNAKIDSINAAVINLKAQLQAQAQSKYDNEHSTFGEIMGGLQTVCSMIPTPYTEAAAAALSLTSKAIGGDYEASFDNGQQVAKNVASLVGPVVNTFKAVTGDIGTIADNLSSGVSDISDNLSSLQSDISSKNFAGAAKIGGGIKDQVSGLYNSTNEEIDSITTSLNNVQNTFNNVMHVSNDEVGSITSQLLTSSPVYAEYQEEIKQIQVAQQELAQQLQASTQQMQVAQNNVYSNLDAESNFSSATYDANAAINHYLSIYANDLAGKAMERLRLYHYYMIKAYEYRTLTPLNTNLDLSSISKQILALLDSSKNSANNINLYTSALAAVYKQELTNIADSIYNYYQDNKPAKTITSTYRLSNAEVATLNSGGAITLNLVQDGVFPPSEEDIRIVGLGVSKMVFKPIPYNQLGNVDEVDFNFGYPNYSRLKKNGIIYNFNNYNLNTKNPISWTSRYDLNSQTLSNAQTSAQDNSMIASLLTTGGHVPTSDADVLLYSLPAAWADINLSMSHFSDSSDLVKVDSVWIQVNYQYEPKPVNQVNVEINSVNKYFAPTFQINRTDNNGNQSGIGDVHRAYTLSSGNFVTATAPKQLGVYKFDSWTNQNGTPLVFNSDVDTVKGTNGGKNKLVFSLATDRSYKAKYVYTGAKLNLPDTVFLGDSLHYNLHIKNTGNGPLNWNIDSMTKWIHDTGSVKGANDTTISLTFDKKPDSIINKIGVLDVSSALTESFHNYIVFVQGPRLAVLDTTSTPNDSSVQNGGNVIILNGDSIRAVYPNPTVTSNIYIAFVNPLTSNATIEVVNSNGDYVMTGLMVAGLTTYNLDVSRLTNGNYFLKIFNSTGLNTTKEIMIRR